MEAVSLAITSMGIEFFYELNLALIPLGALLLMALVQLYFILVVYGKLAVHKVRSHQASDQSPALSVIICAHNEEDNIRKYLPLILQQDYPDFEVIVVDDCSHDDTKWVLRELTQQHHHLRVIEIKEHIQLKHSKKFALTMGIKGACHPYLVLTDADCAPISRNWLREMAGSFGPEKEIVLGYSPYFKKPGALNRLIRFETTHTAMSYLAYALKKNSYMGVGRNLAYAKSLFFQGRGFTDHMHIRSGDDDLFVNQHANKKNVQIAIHPDAHVYSEPKESWASYYKQKARHSGASTLYKGRHQAMLGLQLCSAVCFYLMILVSLCLAPAYWYFVVAAYLVRLLAQFLIYRPIFNKLKVADLLAWLPILDLYYYFYICFNGLFNRQKKHISW